jgi:hypothetical protein
MSKIYVSGPAYVWAGLGQSNSYLFLGFTENGLEVSVNPLNEDIQVDYAGLMPADISQLGQEARISGTFTRYNEQVLLLAQSFLGPQGLAGFGGNGAVGTLVVAEGAAYPLLVWSSYSFKTIFGDMVPGFLFPAAIIADNIPVTLNVRRKAPNLAWRAVPIFGTVNGTTFEPFVAPYNAYQLYTNVMPTQLPPVD